MMITSRKTVGEIAAEMPAAVKVFKKYNIDYCCGGKLSLEEVCAAHGIAQEEMMGELEQALGPRAVDGRNWASTGLRDLATHIVATHHEYLKRELPELAEMMAKVRQAHGEKHSGVLTPLQQVFLDLRAELESHMMKEEMVLFPLIERMEAARKAGAGLPPAHCGSVNNPIRVMEHEHDSAGQALAEMRRLTGDYTVPSDACNTFRALYHGFQEMEADLHQHIHLENNILFPRASRLEADLA
jgi:regulator of cell morphogenesis and NO signaling